MWNLAWHRAAACGIDIGSSAVKLLQLRGSGRGYLVEHCVVRSLPAGTIEARRILDPLAVGAALNEMARARPHVVPRAVVAVPGSAVIARQLEFDAALSEAELELRVSAEAERHIPFAPGEIALDFARLDSPLQSSASAAVQLVACRKEHVAGRVAALARGGYEAAVVEIETQAVERAFALLGDTAGLVALLDLGCGLVTLYVLHDGTVVHVREQATAAARSGMESSQPEVLERAARDQAEQLARALQVFYSSSSYHRVDRVVLAGGGALQPGLAALSAELMQMPVTLADPFAAMRCGSGVDAAQLMREGPALFLAAGLALRGLRDD